MLKDVQNEDSERVLRCQDVIISVLDVFRQEDFILVPPLVAPNFVPSVRVPALALPELPQGFELHAII